MAAHEMRQGKKLMTMDERCSVGIMRSTSKTTDEEFEVFLDTDLSQPINFLNPILLRQPAAENILHFYISTFLHFYILQPHNPGHYSTFTA